MIGHYIMLFVYVNQIAESNHMLDHHKSGKV